MHHALKEILRSNGGVISRGDHPELAGQIDYATRRGELVRVLPNVYVHRDLSRNWRVLARAACVWNSRAVIVGEAAAALTFWPNKTPRIIEVAGVRMRTEWRGYRFTTRSVPAELTFTSRGITVAHPNLTALDMAERHGGDAIDDALRRRMATLDGMRQALALSTDRVGNPLRRRLLLDSRDEPWSSGERRAHRELRRAGITRWRANVPIVCDGSLFYLDIDFDDCPLVAEIDGMGHASPEAFDRDRRRGNLLMLAGKDVLRFTTAMLDEGLFVPTIRSALARYQR
jgi:very-short-patch-repair endonuclease